MNMKKGILLIIALATTLLFACSSCEKSTDNGQDPMENGNEQPSNGNVVDNDPITGKVTGTYTVPTQKSTDGGTVTVSRTPRSVAKFKELRGQIAKEPHGAAACFVVALHMFMENPTVGEECLALSVTPSQRDTKNPKRLASVRQIIYDRFYKKDSGANIYSPWIPYCYIEGFQVAPGWKKPSPPYKMIFGYNPGQDNIDQSDSGTFHGYSIPMTIDAFNNTTSTQSRHRNITAVKVKGEEQYVLIDFDNLINTASYKRP